MFQAGASPAWAWHCVLLVEFGEPFALFPILGRIGTNIGFASVRQVSLLRKGSEVSGEGSERGVCGDESLF